MFFYLEIPCYKFLTSLQFSFRSSRSSLSYFLLTDDQDCWPTPHDFGWCTQSSGSSETVSKRLPTPPHIKQGRDPALVSAQRWYHWYICSRGLFAYVIQETWESLSKNTHWTFSILTSLFCLIRHQNLCSGAGEWNCVTTLMSKHLFSVLPSFTDICWTLFLQGFGGVLTDMVSFYTLSSTVLNHLTYRSLKAAYALYTVTTATPLQQLMEDVLVIAKAVSLSIYVIKDL